MIDDKVLAHKKFLRNQSKLKSIEKRNNRLLSKNSKVLDWSIKSCEMCSRDFKPKLINERFCCYICLINFNKENFKCSKINKVYRGEDWDKQRVLCYDRDLGSCRLCGEQINVSVHHIIPYRLSKDNDLFNLVCLCSVHHPLEDIYFRKYNKPSNWLIKFQEALQ